VKAVAEPFYLLSVELTLLFQNQGHNTFAAQILCKILLSKSIRIHQFLQHFDARNLFDGEMLRFVVRDQNDEQFGRFRLFRSSMVGMDPRDRGVQGRARNLVALRPVPRRRNRT
jgi:hypothetical protein